MKYRTMCTEPAEAELKYYFLFSVSPEYHKKSGDFENQNKYLNLFLCQLLHRFFLLLSTTLSAKKIFQITT